MTEQMKTNLGKDTVVEKKENLSKTYAEEVVKDNPNNHYKDYPFHRQIELTRFNGYDIQQAFEDGFDAGLVECNIKQTQSKYAYASGQYFGWSAFFLISTIFLFPFFNVEFNKEKLCNGDTETILKTYMMGLFVALTLICFFIGIYWRLKKGREEK